MADQESDTNWTRVVIIVLAVMVVYLLWDTYVQQDSLTKVARTVDKSLDNVVDYTGDAVSTVVGGAGELIVGAVDATGDALVYAGSSMQVESENSNNAKTVAELQAAIDNGAVSSPMEGNMIKDLSGVSASEDEQDSEVLDVSKNGGAEGVDVDEGADLESVDNENGGDGSGSEDSVENFYHYYDYPRYCTHCGGKGRYSCNNCENCGYCITPDGYGECVSGDANGPYFREDCIAYEHSANGYRVYKHSPYRHLVGLPYWRKDGYYHDIRGYPRTKYNRRTGSHRRRNRLARQARRNRVTSGTSGSRSGSRTRDVVIPTSRSKSRSASPTGADRRSSFVNYARVSSPRGRAAGVRVASTGKR